MTIDKEIAKWQQQGAEFAAELKKRLFEVEKERALLLDKIHQLEGPSKPPPGQNGLHKGRGLGELSQGIIQLLREAGATGLSLNELFEQLTAEPGSASTTKKNVALTLFRLKERGTVGSIGKPGSSRYILSKP
jgi:hypothetical protein